MTTTNQGAGGEPPESAPMAAGAADDERAAAGELLAGEAGDEDGVAATAPRRRRGSRGGRRHKRPAATPAAPEQDELPPPPDKPAAPVRRRAAAAAGDTPVPAKRAAPVRRRAATAAGDTPAASPGEKPAVAAEDKPAPRRRRRAVSRATPTPSEPPTPVGAPQAESVPAAAASVAPAAKLSRPLATDEGATAEPAGVASAAESGGDETAAAAPKRRRRGARGGRRRRRASEIDHEEATREAEEAAGEPASHEGAPPEEPPRDMSGEAGAAAPPPAEPVAEPGAAASETGSAEPEGEKPAPRARRGARGGRRRSGRRSEAGAPSAPALEEPAATVAGAGDEVATVPAGPAATPAGEAKPRRRDARRPRAIVRQDEGNGLATAPASDLAQKLPAVVVGRPERKLILVSDDGEELRVALVEDGRLAEIYIERPDKKSYLGDIYQGKVESVMNGIDAAFVDFGLEKNGFLYVDEVSAPEGERRARRIGDALKAGQQVLVQVTKDPMGHKGARLSTKISLAGRYLVYVPGGSGVGVSRRLRQGERERLREVSRELKPRNAGLIVRTIAEGHGLEDLRRDLQYLSRLWSRLKKKAESVKPPGLVHKEVDIALEVTRDLFNDTCESMIVDDAKRHKAIVSFLTKEAPELLPRVHLHEGTEPLFEVHGVEDEIARALERRVPLPSGGNLVIDHAEALTVIDVNTGRFTRGKGLEDTITKTNLEAAREVVRQLRLRDIGGIIIIDFIDMAHAKNREMVLATLEAELETDRTKTYVVELSPLGLVEMTRQNTTDGARGILTRTCPACLGKARVVSEETMALSVERRLRALARRAQAKAWLIEVNGSVAERLSGDRLKRLERQIGRRVFFEGSAGLPVDTYRVLAEGTVAHVQEQRVPVREGQEVEVELEFSLTYSPKDAVGYIDGYMVIVEGGRRFLGSRRAVRITATARTGAHATVLKAT